MMAQQQQSRVLRELGGGWLECADAQGVFYYNSVTKQINHKMPPELLPAAPQAQAPAPAQQQVEVLRELPGNWVQCRDAQGTFYYNQVTQQSSDDLPAELRAPAPAPAPAMAPEPAVQVLRELPGGWVECRDAQGIFYHNKVTKQSCDELPAELRAPAPAPAPAQAQAPAAQMLRELPVGWVECRDAQGIFYHNKLTKQSCDELPAELRSSAPAPAAQAHYTTSSQPGVGSQMPNVVKYSTMGASGAPQYSTGSGLGQPYPQQQGLAAYGHYGAPGYGQY